MRAVDGGKKPGLGLKCRGASHNVAAVAVAVAMGFVDCKVGLRVKKSDRWQGLRGSRHCSVPAGVPAGNCCSGCRWMLRSCALQIAGCWQTVGIGEFVA